MRTRCWSRRRRSSRRRRCGRGAHRVGAVRAGAAAQRRFDRHRAAHPRRSAAGLLVPRYQRREAIASASPCAGRQPRHAGRWAAGLSRRRPCRPGVVRPDAQGPGRSRALVLGAGHPVPGHDAAALRRQSRCTGSIWMPPRPPSTRTCLRICSRRSSATIPASITPASRSLRCSRFPTRWERHCCRAGSVPPSAIGHSVGELAAACLAGVLSVDDAARLIAVRGRLMGSLPPGGAMIAVDLDVEQAEALIADEPGCAIAAVNGPRSVAISGAADAVARAHAAIRAAGRQSGEPDGVSCLSLAADGAHRGGIPARAVGARAGSRGVPALLYRARQRSRGPRNGRRLLGQPDLFAGAVFRRSPGRQECGVPTMSPRLVRGPRCSRWPGSADCRRRPGR